MAIGLVTSGSPAKSVAWKPSGSVILAAAWPVGVGASGGARSASAAAARRRPMARGCMGLPRGDGMRAAWSDEGHCSVGSAAPPSPVRLYIRRATRSGRNILTGIIAAGCYNGMRTCAPPNRPCPLASLFSASACRRGHIEVRSQITVSPWIVSEKNVRFFSPPDSGKRGRRRTASLGRTRRGPDTWNFPITNRRKHYGRRP